MFDFFTENIAIIALLLLVMWGLQFAMAYFQMRRFYARLKIVRKVGVTAVGMAGSQYRGRVYAILTIDNDRKVLHAEKMSGWSNFSGLRPVPELVGMNLSQIIDPQVQLPVPDKLAQAFRNAAAYIQNAPQGGAAKALGANGANPDTPKEEKEVVDR